MFVWTAYLYRGEIAGFTARVTGWRWAKAISADAAAAVKAPPVPWHEALERCHAAFVKYMKVPAGPVIGNRQIAASDKFRPHVERLCRLLDEQGIPRPDIPDGIVFNDTHKWSVFLAKLWAFRDDPEQAKKVYPKMREGTCPAA